MGAHGGTSPRPVLLIDNLITMTVDRHHHSTLGPLLTLDDVAAILRVSKTSVYRLVERRELPFCRVGRSLRFTQQDVGAYLGARYVRSAVADDNTHECTQDPGALVR